MAEQQEEKQAAFSSLQTLAGRVKDGTFREILEDWAWIFSYSRRYKGAIVFYTVLGILSTTLSLAAGIAGKYLIDIITGHQTDKLWFLIILMLSSAAVSLLFSSLISRLSAKISIDIGNDIQADIFDRIIDVDWEALSAYSSGDLMNRFNSDVSAVSANAISWLPSVIIALYNLAATFAVIWHYDRVMSLLAFVTAPVMLLMSKYFIKKQREYARKMKETGSRMIGFEVETFYNVDTIKSFGIMESYGKKLRDWQARYKDISLTYNLFTIKTGVFMKVLGLIVQYAAFGYCLFLLWTGQITYGTMTLFLEQRVRLSTAFGNVAGIIPQFLSSSVSAHRIRELTELPKEKHLPESRDLLKVSGKGFEVRMDSVTFAYSGDDVVLTDSAFYACPGEIVALVGPSGEGKTTLVRLFLGLVHPDEGNVYLQSAEDGTRVEMNADSRCLFSYVPQGNTILSGTIAENLRMVKEDATDEEIIEALKVACAYDFVMQMPDGIYSAVGERGRGLSEGQAQRIAIARAVLRDAPVLLLDEATSALDTATEREVLRNIIRQRPEKTCIVTTHRPSVLSMCRRVYRVLETRVTEVDREETGQLLKDF
ncbi:MAG: ABC transporter ATP-binding protein [Lachnospiraceae bacterium]|nr:ABC transporter ATP-binding protein [Lachnospiraceae bacterium]